MRWINGSSATGMSFFITGLPRSRTAWMSVFMTYQDTFCYHDAMNGCHSHQEFIKKIGGDGDSDSGLMYFPIKTYFPDSPVLIIERNIDDVVQSLIKIDVFNDEVYRGLTISLSLLNKMDGLRVDFQNLDYEEVWSHLVGKGFDKERADFLSKFNIQDIRIPNTDAMISFLQE